MRAIEYGTDQQAGRCHFEERPRVIWLWAVTIVTTMGFGKTPGVGLVVSTVGSGTLSKQASTTDQSAGRSFKSEGKLSPHRLGQRRVVLRVTMQVIQVSNMAAFTAKGTLYQVTVKAERRPNPLPHVRAGHQRPLPLAMLVVNTFIFKKRKCGCATVVA